MGRLRKPTAVKEASGALRKNPKRRNKREPKPPEGWPDRPKWIDDDKIARGCWDSTCTLLESMKLLTKADGHPVAAYCSDFSQWYTLREQIKSGEVSQATEHGMKVKVEATQLHKYQDRMFRFWSEYGLTPSSRSKLVASQAEKEENPMDALIAAQGNG